MVEHISCYNEQEREEVNLGEHMCYLVQIAKKERSMATQITTTAIHHIRLIVTNAVRSRDFYTSLLNFTVAAELPPGFVLTDGKILLGITPAWDASLAPPNDRFSPNRVGLDHLSFSVANKAEL